ncbi:MAG: hypothetical protein II689_00620, partial [Firmicutes bacterium]|nr:hypothetical protein [Bacillota bacterium]
DLSYEIYLVQYPLIFLYQYLFYGRYSPAGRALLITAACVLISIPLHFCFNWKGGRTRVPKLRALAALLLAAVCFLGASDYVDARDHREELAQLEAQLEASEEEMLERQAAYAAARAARAAEEESSREKMLSDLAAGRDGLADVATNLDITAIGDSVMLGAVKNLSDRFPNCYCDAAKSRTAWVVCGIIEDLKSKNMLGDIVILHFGTNGDAPERIKDDIMASCGDRRVYWVGVTNDRSVHVNDKLKAFVEKYDNASYIDWPAYSSGHGEYFGTDGIHLTNEGREAYTQMIYDVLYEELLERYEAEAAEIIKAHDDSVVPEETMAFYGDELLAAVYDELYASYPEAFYAADAVSSFESLVESIKKSGTDGVLPRRMIFVLGRDTKLGADQYKELLSLCEGSDVTFMTAGDTADLLALKSSADFELVDLGSELDSDPAYLAADRKHLSDEGRRAAAALIKGAL